MSLGQRWPTSSRSIIITSGMVGALAAADTYGRELAGGPVGTAVGGAVGAIVGGAVGVWITLGIASCYKRISCWLLPIILKIAAFLQVQM